MSSVEIITDANRNGTTVVLCDDIKEAIQITTKLRGFIKYNGLVNYEIKRNGLEVTVIYTPELRAV